MPDIAIAFFALGLLAGLARSDLKLPAPVSDTLSILLMLVLGLKGGMALHGRFSLAILGELLPIAALGALLPLACYPVLRRWVRLSQPDAASIAAHYGSVSAGTFAVALGMAERLHLALAPQTALYLAMLELPAIVVVLLRYRRTPGQPVSGSSNSAPATAALRGAFSSRGVLLLGGGILIGYLYGPAGLAPLQPVLLAGFSTMLSLFLLDMGMSTARACAPLPWRHWRLMAFAAIAPFVLCWAGIALALWLRLPPGSALALAGLTASASYIAAPAAMRSAIPQADTGLAMLAALGITFPVNVLIGLPVYKYFLDRLL